MSKTRKTYEVLRSHRWYGPHDLRSAGHRCRRPPWRFEGGYGWFCGRHIRQANDGCDLDYLGTSHGAPVEEPAIY
ncbi:MAG: hypothetical protein ACR2PO_11870 [Methyloligellaceae bacterium]